MKYIYPYECEKLKLSTSAELQLAIDGNRREGRRPGYGDYGDGFLASSGLSALANGRQQSSPPSSPRSREFVLMLSTIMVYLSLSLQINCNR